MKGWWQTIAGALSGLGLSVLTTIGAIVPAYASPWQQFPEELLISATIAPSPPDLEISETAFPSFQSSTLDQQLRRYRRYLHRFGVPDVLIVGSSRALQGVDPIALQRALEEQGYPELRIFNFGINGATAQVVDSLVRKILPPDQLPPLILWADGLRAFNSGRPDRTQELIVSSPGYRALLAGQYPTQWQSAENLREAEKIRFYRCNGPIVDRSPDLIQNGVCETDTVGSVPPFNPFAQFTSPEELGFSVVETRFDPKTYYQRYPRIPGQFDGDYQNFSLAGPQAIATTNLIRFTQTRQITLVIVNLPLSRDYLDAFRIEREMAFSQYLTRLASATTHLHFWDLGRSALDQPDYFEDPSHLNRYGAAFVSQQLAQQNMVTWYPSTNHPVE